MSRGFTAAIGALLLMAIFGCGQSQQATTAEKDKGRLFGVVYQTFNNPFFVDLNEGMKEVIEAHGDRLESIDSHFDSQKQLKDISDLMLKGVTAVFINPVNWEGIKGSLIQGKQKGIPCVVIDAPVKDEDLVLCQVASDNVEAGRLAARALAQVKPDAKVVILHLSVNKACIDRVAGFREEAAKYPGMKILDIQEGKGTTDGARPVMRDLLGRFPELNAVFPINDPSALGAISALESAGRLNDVTVVTVDGSAEGVNAIKTGKLHSTSAQSPREIGRVAAEKVYEFLEGKTVEKDIKIPVELVTKENADAYLQKREAALQPKPAPGA